MIDYLKGYLMSESSQFNNGGIKPTIDSELDSLLFEEDFGLDKKANEKANMKMLDEELDTLMDDVFDDDPDMLLDELEVEEFLNESEDDKKSKKGD